MDLGTEFGLNVAPDGKSQARVFRGKVEAALTDDEGITQRTHVVREREAFQIDPGAGSMAAYEGPGDFLDRTVVPTPPLVLDPGYPGAVRGAAPWGYWRFESLADGAIPNEVPGRPPLRAVGPVRLAEMPGGNRCAEFRAVDDRQDLEMDGLWRPTWRPGFAVELWCVSEAISHTTLAGMARPDDANLHNFLLELTSRNGLHKPASVRLLHRWPAGGGDGDNVYSHGPYVPYRWHHVVGQVRVGRMELFVDGEPESSLSVNPDHQETSCRFLLGRLTPRTGTGISIDRPLVGRLDEVALYDHPLTPEQIREHHRLGRPARGH
jgi:hypothetical protein